MTNIFTKLKWITFTGLFFLIIFAANNSSVYSEEVGSSKYKDTPQIGIANDMGEAAKREVSKVREDFKKQARSLFKRKTIGWNISTVQYLYRGVLSLPDRIPKLTGKIVEESRFLGLVGALLIFIFVLVFFYSLSGRNRALRWVDRKSLPVKQHIPEDYYPYFLSLTKLAVSTLIPLLLTGLFYLINRMAEIRAAWFDLFGQMLLLWTFSAFMLSLLKESLTRNLFKVTADYGKTIFYYSRLILLYTIIGVALFWTSKVLEVRGDVPELIRFSVSVTVATLIFLLLLRKKTFLSLLPKLPHRGYMWILNFLINHYYSILIFSYIAVLIWCLGYNELGRLVLTKFYWTVGAFLAINLIHYFCTSHIRGWSKKLNAKDETAQFLLKSMKTFLFYITVLFTIIVLLNLLDLLNPLERIMSFPIFQLGDRMVSPWIIIKAIAVLLAFIFVSRLLQAYLDYKIYPAIGVDPGLGYALNTFFKYLSLIIGIFISISMVGIDLRFLLVFAGAAGIGIGLGLQNIAANLISGFTLIFGGKIRKGDWIEVGETMGVVTDIFLRATKVRTRDNIEYLIPNSDLVSNTMVNYSLSSPFIRIGLPLGVSYKTDPRDVEMIMVKVAEKEALVSDYEKPLVRFVEYGESSINFELLFWIDVRTVPRRKVRSNLYFDIFDEFKKAGIEIPFPQRDIHIRDKAK